MSNLVTPSKQLPITTENRAAWLREAGGLSAALADGLLFDVVEPPLAEVLVLGLMKQGVTKYLAIFGHGNTAIAEILRIYEAHGLVKCWQFRNEVEMAHAATALSWVYGEVPAVLTSIGPGALQALAGSLAAASNGVGVYHLYGDETTHGEGYNMQQIPRPGQGLFGSLRTDGGVLYVAYPRCVARRVAQWQCGRVSSVAARAVLSESAAEHDQQIGLLHGPVAADRPFRPRHVQVMRMRVGQNTHRSGAQDRDRAAGFGQPPHGHRRMTRAGADLDGDPLRARDQLRSCGQERLVRYRQTRPHGSGGKRIESQRHPRQLRCRCISKERGAFVVVLDVGWIGVDIDQSSASGWPWR
jgi:hypothetical protein